MDTLQRQRQISTQDAPRQATPLHPPTTHDRYYRPELDWLRFVAYTLVFAVHACPQTTEGYLHMGVPLAIAQYVLVPVVMSGFHGVDLFFVLSAFLITELLLREKEKTGTIHIKYFYARRILRIWPLYFLFVLIVFPLELRSVVAQPLDYYFSFLAFVGNWYGVLFGTTWNGTSHLWTVCVEEQFYLIWPIILLRLSKRRLVLTLIAVAGFATLYRTLLIAGTWPDAISVQRNTFARMDCFALGGLLACTLHGRKLVLPFRKRALFLLPAVALLWLVGSSPGMEDAKTALWSYSAAAAGCGLLLLAFVTMPTRRQRRTPTRIIAYLGKISYGLYMWHYPIYWLTLLCILPDGIMDTHVLTVLRIAYPFGLTILVSIVSYELFEKRFLRIKRRFTFIESRPE